MTLTEILEQVKKLTPQERHELVEQLRTMQDTPEPQESAQPEEHWGKSLNRLMNEIGTIEMLYPEIDDPVEWVNHLRAEQRRRRLDNWGEEDRSDETE